MHLPERLINLSVFNGRDLQRSLFILRMREWSRISLFTLQFSNYFHSKSVRLFKLFEYCSTCGGGITIILWLCDTGVPLPLAFNAVDHSFNQQSAAGLYRELWFKWELEQKGNARRKVFGWKCAV